MGLTPITVGDLLVLLLLGIIGCHCVWQASRGRWQLLDPLNFFFVGMVMVFVVQLLQGGQSFALRHGATVVNQTLLGATFTTVMAIVGYEAQVGVRVGWRLPAIAPRLDPARLQVVAWVVIAIGLFGYALVFYRVGGVDAFLAKGRGWATPIRSVPFIPASLQTFVMQLQHMLPIGCLMLLFRAFMFPIPNLYRLVAFGVNGLAWAWFLYLGTRSRLTWFTLAIMTALYLTRRKSPPLWLGATTLAALFLLTAFQQQYRNQFTHLSFNLSEHQKQEVWQRIVPSFLLPNAGGGGTSLSVSSELNCAMTVIKLVPDSVPYNYGFGWLELITRWVPRAAWPSKLYPHLESMQDVLEQGGLSDHRDARTGMLSGPAFSIVGHWYAAGGAVGLAIGGLLVGIVVRIVRTILDRSARNQSYLLLYPPLMMVGFLDAMGTPFYWVFYVPFTLGPTLLALWLCRMRDHPSRRRRPEFRFRDTHPHTMKWGEGFSYL